MNKLKNFQKNLTNMKNSLKKANNKNNLIEFINKRKSSMV